MNKTQLFEQITKKQSFLCTGLDTAIDQIPAFLREMPEALFEFNRRIIDATARYSVAYKPNTAFYESAGLKGWQALEKTVEYIRTNYPDIFLIADAKRGDIGNTSKMYAKTFFETLDFDAVTVAPYMGEDSVSPFLGYKNKWVILLALTSNQGAFDFQFIKKQQTGESLFETVLKKSKNWGDEESMMYVVGATKADMLSDIRKIVPEHFLLVPGVGAQGGSLDEVVKHGANKQCGLLVNSSRGIIYADKTENFDKTAEIKAREIQTEMAEYLK